MKKLIFTGLLSLVFIANAGAESLIDRPLVDKKTYDIIYQSTEAFLEYSDDNVSGGLDGDLENMTIISQKLNPNNATLLTVEFLAFFMTTDWDFGDPVDEEFTRCTSTLEKLPGQPFTIEKTKTTCTYNPSDEISPSDEEAHPCCEGGPVVDSNFCFDSYEEGKDFCDSLDDYN